MNSFINTTRTGTEWDLVTGGDKGREGGSNVAVSGGKIHSHSIGVVFLSVVDGMLRFKGQECFYCQRDERRSPWTDLCPWI